MTDQKEDDGAIRVMVVDDSAVVRGMITKLLEVDPEIRVVSTVGDGQRAVDQAGRKTLDVIVLDVEMPVMDGLTAIPKLMMASPNSKILMVSKLTRINAEVSMKAMALGASDYVPKPMAGHNADATAEFGHELRDKLKALGFSAYRRRTGHSPNPSTAAKAPPPRSSNSSGGLTQSRTQLISQIVKTSAARPEPAPKLRVIAIGSSTGGPQALFEVMASLKSDITQPIVITQHMPPTFTTILAEHITRHSGVSCSEAKHGEVLRDRHAYVAPGDYHMTFEQRGSATTIQLSQSAPENFCRPAVDAMLRSLVSIYGGAIMATILTGMGHDGLKGCELVRGAGGTVLAQDEASSVVWGMPGAVAQAGLAESVLPLKEIGPAMRRIALRTAV